MCRSCLSSISAPSYSIRSLTYEGFNDCAVYGAVKARDDRSWYSVGYSCLNAGVLLVLTTTVAGFVEVVPA